MAIRAAKAAEKTTKRGCFIAMRAAMRKVLSPISENIIIDRERRKEWSGCIKEAGAEVSKLLEGVKDLMISLICSGSFLEVVGGTGWGISWGFSGRSAGFYGHSTQYLY